MRVVSTVFALAVSLMIGGNLLAADEKTAPEGGRHHHSMMGQWNAFPDQMLKGLNLTDDQKAKVEALKKEYAPKLKEAADSVLTADQKKARDDAVKAAKDAGKTGPEVFMAARTATKLTDEQRAKMQEVIKPLRKEVQEKVMALLTPEQQAQFQKEMKHRRGRRAEGNQTPPSGTQ